MRTESGGHVRFEKNIKVAFVHGKPFSHQLLLNFPFTPLACGPLLQKSTLNRSRGLFFHILSFNPNSDFSQSASAVYRYNIFRYKENKENKENKKEMWWSSFFASSQTIASHFSQGSQIYIEAANFFSSSRTTPPTAFNCSSQDGGETQIAPGICKLVME